MLSFFGLSGIVAAAASAEADRYTMHYFKEPRSLALDSERVAVFRSAALASDNWSAVTESPVLDRFGVGGFEKFAQAGWYIGRTAFIEAAGSRVENLVTAMADDPAVDFVSPVLIDEKGDPLLITQDLLVRFEPQVETAAALRILDENIGGTILDRDFAHLPNLYRVRSPSRDGFVVLAQANALATLPEVRYAEPDLVVTARYDLIPNDTHWGLLWGLHQANDFDMDAPEAWDITTGDPSVRVVVMDSGVQQDHPDINQVTGMTFNPGQGSVDGGPGNVCDNHGTTVAGCVSARINNALGTVGIAPNARVASAYVFATSLVGCGSSGSAPTTALVNALDWAQTSGARVTSASLTLIPISTLTDKYASTYAAGVLHFAATGNSGAVGVGYPANLSVVMAIGAISQNGNRAGFSTYGSQIDLVAPGQDITTTDRTGTSGYGAGDYVTLFGTSYSTPYAAGVAALVLSVDPSLTPAEVSFILRSTAVDRGPTGFDQQYGHGIVNAFAACSWALNPPPAPGDFNLTAPADSAVGVSRTPLFTWSGATNVLDYTITVDDEASFVNPDITQTVVTNFLASPITLEPGRMYFWKVVARNAVATNESTPVVGAFRTIIDCNNNGVDDATDIANATAQDCNGNGIPDSCDLASGNYAFRSLDYTPIEAVMPQAIVIDNVPPATGNVTLDFRALSDLNTSSELFSIDLSGLPVGDVFGPTGSDCSAVQEALIVPMATWNAARGGNSITINVVPSANVNAAICQNASWVNVTVTYSAGPRSADADHNNVPDECVPQCLCADANCDGSITVADIGFFVTAVSQGSAAWNALFPGGTAPCDFICANDTNGDNAVTVGDIGGFVQAVTGGGCP